ncbi:uridine kinase family protein [Ferdinandcohnia quinoae]|uniref:Phosphoribulokinase n=1 Tax=Fredinandcohnia quinoae TaxID=2918902 RepID=A0AAW5E449_9BACI|nr:phosphoribulokinase [Fredinandcohnia sp. SECRCQ15]MCH1627720.1 phosphoribulokinase [Fredinandcohnia sp. SECRCQ15]
MDTLLNDIAKFIRDKNQKIIIGISGHGASGKTTFANNLLKLLETNDVNYLNTDPYIIGSTIRKFAAINYEYMNENHHYKMTACHPAAHNLTALERDIMMIRDGLDFYTIDAHYSKSTLISSKNQVNIIEGMSVAFINPNLFDLKIYLYTDGETELMRRSIRDVSERGTEMTYLRKSHDERRIQYDVFMHPYHRNFDIVIRNSNEGYLLEKCDFNKM